ncbi:MAG: SdiA-regulated domain-containing protein [Chitinophagaceae bacterium]
MKPIYEFQRIRKKRQTMKNILKIAVLLVIIALAVAFRSDIKRAFAAAPSKDKTDQPYPGSPGVTIKKKWELEKILVEISGLAYLDGDRFACVQDELGTIFIYNTGTAAIEKEIPFGGPGDYEGLTLVDNTAWVVRSDGRLFEVNDITSAKPTVKEYSTPLTAEHNVEGLCYDKEHNRLLLAIKDMEPGNPDYKGIYAFDLATATLQPQPAFKIALDHAVFASSTGQNKKKNKAGIMPSAIAIHPVTGDMYITDGRKSRLLITDPAGNIKKLYQLDSHDFTQPEGITFKPSGELFISNEGTNQAGNIVSVEITKQ